MNDQDLKKQLNRLKVTGPSEASRERARHRAMTAFENRNSISDDPAKPRLILWPRIAWATVAGIVIVVCLLHSVFTQPFETIAKPDASDGIDHVWSSTPSQSTATLVNDRTILRQIEQLFPDQVNAVVENHGKLDLSIAQTPLIGSSQPVVVIFEKGNDTVRVLSYSGHRFCIALGRTENCFEITVTPEGGVLLEDSKHVWSASDNAQIAGYTFRANTMETAL